MCVRETRRDYARREVLIRPEEPIALHLDLWKPIVFLFELRVLLRSQDGFGLLHVFGLARLGATRLHVLGHCRVHLLPLLRRKIEVGQRNGAGHLRFLLLILDLQHALAVFARKQSGCCKRSLCN